MRTRRLVLVALVVASACSDDDEAASTTVAPPVTTSLATTEITGSTASTTPTPATTDATATTGAPGTTDATASTSVAASTTCPEVDTGVNEITLTGGGADHPVRIYVPSTSTGQPLPAVLDWHGLGSNGPDQASYTGYEELAESEGFLVVHPTGIANSWELDGFDDPNRDDIAFAATLIDTLIADWCADAERIYSTGMSNGGFFTSRLVCNLADRIAAASSVAGTSHPDGCAPDRPVPYLAFHGTADAVVPFDGNGQSVLGGSGDDPALQALFTQVIPDEFAEFAADAGCAAEPTATPVGEDVIRHDYASCVDGTPLTFFEVTGGGHTWPGSPMAAVTAALGYTTDDVDATADSWAFFEQHSLTGEG